MWVDLGVEWVGEPEARKGDREMVDVGSLGCHMRRRKDSPENWASRSPTAGPWCQAGGWYSWLFCICHSFVAM